MKTWRAALAAVLTGACATSYAQTESLPAEPIANTYPVLSASTLTHLYDPSWWYMDCAPLELGADSVGLCDYDGGRLCITKANFGGTGMYPTSYSQKIPVWVTLTKFSADGSKTTLRENAVYCDGCGRITRNTPVITLNGYEGPDVTITYGEKIYGETSAQITIHEKYSTFTQSASVKITVDGEETTKGTVPTVGTHTVVVTSEQLGNNKFRSSEKVIVGFAETSKTFTLKVVYPLTVSNKATITSRPANGTKSLGRITIPAPDNLPDGLEDPGLQISEIDASAVSAEPGTYTVRYRLSAANTNYTLDSDTWRETTFTITKSPTLTEPLVSCGEVIPSDLLSRVYDHKWYAAGGQVSGLNPTEFTEIDGGVAIITRIFIGEAGSGESGWNYPKNYEDGLPVYADIVFATADGDTTILSGRRLYCGSCGHIERQTPTVTLNGSESETVVMKLGEVLNAATSATGADVTMTIDGAAAANGDVPSVGTHTVVVTSAQTTGENLDPTKGDVVLGFKEVVKTFSLTVASPSLTEPLISYGEVIPSDLLSRVYDYKWYAAGGQVSGLTPTRLTEISGGAAIITRIFIGQAGSGESGWSYPKDYEDGLPVYAEVAFATSGGDTTLLSRRYLYCESCGRITRNTPTITLNGSEGPDVTITYGEKLDAQPNTQISYVDKQGTPVIQFGGVWVYVDGEETTNGTVPTVGTHTVLVISKELGNDEMGAKSVVGYARTEKVFTLTVLGDGSCQEGVVRLKFGNTLIADNSAGEYTAFQWMADGSAIAGATKQYYHARPLPEGSYAVVLTLADGSTVTSCPLRVEASAGLAMHVSPSAVRAGEAVTVVVSGYGSEGAEVSAYAVSGVRVAHGEVDAEGVVCLRLPRGLVVIRASADGETVETRVVCH